MLASPTIGADGTIYIGSSANRFYAFNPNGTTAHVYTVGASIYSGSALDDSGTIYVGCRDSNVYAFAGTGAGLADSPWPKFRADARNTGRTTLLAPPNVAASDGLYAGYVKVTWSSLTNAVSYDVWRSASSNLAQAAFLGQTTSTNLYDTGAAPWTPYYYWVKAKYTMANSCLGGGASGWRRASPNVAADYDRDGKADPAVYEQATGTWRVWLSIADYYAVTVSGWGGPGLIPVPADYDNDGLADPAVYDQAAGTWQVWLSIADYYHVAVSGWGGPGLIPVPADYDGDGKTDPTVRLEAASLWSTWLSIIDYVRAIDFSY